jgi:hypothetical protein
MAEPFRERLWAVGSGWEGPFQHESVLVAAVSREDAMARAEAAFADVRQPVCRAKMRLRDLGPLAPGLVVGPLTSGSTLLEDGDESGRRCAPEAAGRAEQG